MNKCDVSGDPELLSLVELEIRELMSRYGFPGIQSNQLIQIKLIQIKSIQIDWNWHITLNNLQIIDTN